MRNRNTNSRIAKLQAEAEKSFRNYNGAVAGTGNGQFVNLGGGFGNVNGSANITPRTIAVTIQNTDEDSSLSAPLFSVTEGFIAPFDGVGSREGDTKDFITDKTPKAGKGIIIKYQDYSPEEIKELCRTSPFNIQGYRYIFGNEAQLYLPWVLRRKAGSYEMKDTHRPSEYQSLANQIQTTLDNSEFAWKVDGKGTIFIVLEKALSSSQPRQVQLIFRVTAEADLANALTAESVLKTQ